MRISQALPQYLAYRRGEGYSKNTIKADRVAVNRLMEVVGDRDLDSITPVLVDGLYAEMTRRQLRASTVNLATACLRSFFKWAIERGYRSQEAGSPVLGRRYRPREAKTLTRVPLAQFPALLEAARSPRDRMLLALGIYTMARKEEITGIRIRDVDLDSGEIQIYVSKSNVFDRRPISTELDLELRRWLTAYAEEVGPLEPDYFLVPAVHGGTRSKTTHGWRLRPRKQMVSPEDVVHSVLKPLGIDDSYHSGMHVLRRSAARARFDELTAQGYDGALRQVSAWLNHKSTAQTEIYLGLELDRANRDEQTKGKPLFPSLAASNVRHLEVPNGQDRTA